MNSPRTSHSIKQRQCGAVFLIMLVIMVMGVVAFFVGSLSSSAFQVKRDEVTAKALAQAKDALIGYATSAQVDFTTCLAPGNNCTRLGDLPCPDTDNDGISGDATYTTCDLPSQRIGRLPWKTLDIPDLRDGNGERLWYAVSNSFKNNTRTLCTASGQPGCLNSDTTGTITVRSPNGNIIHNGCSAYGLPNCPNPGASDAAFGTGAVALIIAPGSVLARLGSGSAQDRSNAGINSPQNYLDTTLAEDNANFTDSTSTDGFIQGVIKDGSNNVIVNDHILVITQDNIMDVIQKRVAGEAKQCLNEYAAHTQNKGRYPWAVPPADFTTYQDSSDQIFGRIPNTPFTKTCENSGGWPSGHGSNNCSSSGTPLIGMKNNWTGNCNINSASGWWLNWQDLVFYSLADAYKPTTPLVAPAVNACAGAGACLVVNPTAPTATNRFVVLVAGKMLATQSLRPTNKAAPTYYVEDQNSVLGTTTFTQSGVSATFNDTVVFQ